jgi:signal peptidase II
VRRVHLSVGLFLLAAAAALAADLVTKNGIVGWLGPGASVSVIGDFLRITHVRNIGASFGLFPGNRIALIAVSSLAILVVFFLAVRSRGRTPAMVFLGLILGGALGNLYDRLRLGEVIDFVDVGIGSHRWPVFNVADIAVTLGVFLLLIEYLRRGGGRDGDESDDEGHGEIEARHGGP